ncbi:MAG: M48 family metallopeptidase [Vicinamibacterales bacterium]
MNEDKATRYHRLRRRASILGAGLGALVLLLLLVTGASAAMRDFAYARAGGLFTLTVVLYVGLVALITEAVQVPLAFHLGVTLERRFGLSTETTARWWWDHVKVAAIGLLFATTAAVLVCWLIRWSPERWWIAAAAAFSAVTIGLAQLAPVVLLPLFYELEPLDRPALSERLVALANRAGAPVLGVFEWRLGDRTRKANAALTGLGRTRRIIVSDTLLADHSDDEIEVILAHELAHHVHGDIWRGIALEMAVLMAGLFAADLAIGAAAGRFGITAKWDPAALPLVVLAGGAVSLALTPLANALSRAHERRADRYALATTGNVPAFTSAMKRLGAQNLAEERPSRLVEWLFYTHPPVAARIELAEAWSSSQKRPS